MIEPLETSERSAQDEGWPVNTRDWLQTIAATVLWKSTVLYVFYCAIYPVVSNTMSRPVSAIAPSTFHRSCDEI